MLIRSKLIKTGKLAWTLRCPCVEDAAELSKLRVQIDSETDYLDREVGEGLLSEFDYIELIKSDLENPKNIFLLAEVNGQIVGFARCINQKLARFSHQSDFGICILQAYCGYGIGRVLIKNIVELSKEAGIEKILLSVIETNTNAIKLYESFGFTKEGLLLKDRKIDGQYYNTLIMGRF